MVNSKRSLLVGGLGAIFLCAGFGAHAQDAGNSSNTVIGPPQLKDFSLTPRARIVTQPAPDTERPIELAPPPPVTTAPRQGPAAGVAPAQPAAAARPPTRQIREATGPVSQDAPPAGPPTATPAPAFEAPVVEAPAVLPETPAAIPAADRDTGSSIWYYALPAGALALVGLAVVRRRRRNGVLVPVADPIPVAAEPPKPRPDPIPRPWLELSLKAERASFTPTEAVVMFELEIKNSGGSPAHNLRIDVKMFNAGAEQDKEIGSFFRTAGREQTKLKLPSIAAGVTGVIKGQVQLSVEEMRAVRLNERLLFIPVVAVNALYDRDGGRTGQTSRSYVIGRELQAPSEKMGAFRVDQGPRIWRTVGQRAHKLAKRV